MSASVEEAARITYRNDLLRSPFYGILEAGWTALVLVIAIRAFDAPEAVKALIAGAGPLGFVFAPVLLYVVSRLGLTPSRTAAITYAASGVFIAGAALAGTLPFFAALLITGQVLSAQQGTVMVHIYDANYPAKERGTRLGSAFLRVAIFAILFSVLGGRLLDIAIGNYVSILLMMAGASLACSFFVNRIPSEPLSPKDVGSPWQSYSLIWQDKLFGALLAFWMLLGLGNLLTLPIRVEYLANPAYGIDADNTTVAILLLVVPSVSRILSTRLWGRLFDRLNLITTRLLLNACFLVGIFLFFFTTNLLLMGVAMAFFGAAVGGGKIMWTLWVTRIAPAGKASSYMSVHMALTGVRGSLAPFLGYWVLTQTDPRTVGLTGSALVIISSVFFAQLRRNPRLK